MSSELPALWSSGSDKDKKLIPLPSYGRRPAAKSKLVELFPKCLSDLKKWLARSSRDSMVVQSFIIKHDHRICLIFDKRTILFRSESSNPFTKMIMGVNEGLELLKLRFDHKTIKDYEKVDKVRHYCRLLEKMRVFSRISNDCSTQFWDLIEARKWVVSYMLLHSENVEDCKWLFEKKERLGISDASVEQYERDFALEGKKKRYTRFNSFSCC